MNHKGFTILALLGLMLISSLITMFLTGVYLGYELKKFQNKLWLTQYNGIHSILYDRPPAG